MKNLIKQLRYPSMVKIMEICEKSAQKQSWDMPEADKNLNWIQLTYLKFH